MDTSEPATPSTSYANATIKQFVNWLDIRGFFNFYEAPEFIYIQKAVKEIFPNDPKLIVQKWLDLWQVSLKLFRWGNLFPIPYI